ncbi:hypothetical protein HanRHA438_Chr10g0461601 [Helianthus annuus]|nr:hypothetical protein HanRHA438_Chr10g0461601 [Helianthus annuus]
MSFCLFTNHLHQKLNPSFLSSSCTQLFSHLSTSAITAPPPAPPLAPPPAPPTTPPQPLDVASAPRSLLSFWHKSKP